jgi:hypothetical protein
MTKKSEITSWVSQNAPQDKKLVDFSSLQECLEKLQKILSPTLRQATVCPSEEALQYIKDMVMTLLRRITTTSQNYDAYIKEMVKSNFNSTPEIKPENVYRYIGFSVNPAHIPFKSIYHALKSKKAKAGSDQESLALRQISYLLSTHVGKKEFDYYLAEQASGKDYLTQLAWVVPNEQTENAAKQIILELFQQLSESGKTIVIS